MLQYFKLWSPKSYIRNYAKGSIKMKYLNVAEKHDAAKNIANLLSNGTARRREGYSVYNKVFDFDATVKNCNSKMVMTSVSGHLLQFEFLVSYRNWRNVDPQALFDAPIRKSCNEDYMPIKRTLEREIRGCNGLIIWTDCDREGENIAFEIIDVCRAVKSNIAVYRAVFSEITAAAVRRALQNIASPDKRQSDAVDVRTELDLRTGAAITRFQTMRLQRLFPEKIGTKLISYGSCQIPTLGFVAERYKEVEAFVSEPFWKIKVNHTIDDLTVDFNWSRNRLFDQQECEDYLLLCLAEPKATVESVTVKPKSKWRPTPLDTVEMEKLGSRKLKLSAKETMTIAEKLYTRGIISYPRTETNQFSKEIDLRSLVEQQSSHDIWGEFARRVIEWGPNPRNGNKTDQAHPPIHPTKLVTNLEGNDKRVYELICRHFLACVSKDAIGSETIVHINIAGEKFTATGLCIYERNYLDVYIYDKWNAKQIHKYEQGDVFEPTEISMQEGATTAPPLLTEADLIALMEKHGIGTDATHADHINTIKERGYIGVVDKGCLVPGVIGMGLYEGYDAMDLALAKPNLRAEFEVDLKKICLGEKQPKTVLEDQIQKYKIAYQQIMEKISAMDEKVGLRIQETPVPASAATAENSTYDAENNPSHFQELFKCPKCSVAQLALRQKKNQTGHFISCLNYPDCKNAIWLATECTEPVVLSEECQRCGTGVKLLKVKFIAAYFKSLFAAPFGWYKTCLRCDAKFREAFNINVDTVKQVGAIVSDTRTAPVPTRAAVTSIHNRTAAPANSKRNTNTASSTRSTGPSGSNSDRGKKPKLSKGSSTTTKTAQSNIRAFFSTGSSTDAYDVCPEMAVPQCTEANVAVQQNDHAIEAFFNDNDGFDDIFLGSDADLTISTNRNLNSNTNSELSANTAAFFANDENEFEDFSWGSGRLAARVPAGNRSTINQTDNNFQRYSQNESTTTQRRNNNTGDNSTAKRPRQEMDHQTERLPDQSVKCMGCHQLAKSLTVKKDGPNKGRVFYVCPKNQPGSCKFFQWDTEDSSGNPSLSTEATTSNTFNNSFNNSFNNPFNNANDTADPAGFRCNCGVAASSLIVRKEGPNKGRPFYACANRDHACGFFKWGDDNDEAPTTSSRSNQNTTGPGGRNSSQNYSSGGTSQIPATSRSNQRDSKKRKCGLCRQEGHTKQKCPRKAEFEY